MSSTLSLHIPVAVYACFLLPLCCSRVVTVTFMEPADAVRWEEQRKKASQSGAPVITRNGAGSQPKQQAPSDTGTTGTAGSRRELRADNVREQALVQEVGNFGRLGLLSASLKCVPTHEQTRERRLIAMFGSGPGCGTGHCTP